MSEKWNSFVDLWSSRISPFRANDGLEEWKKYIELCELECLREAVDRLGNVAAMNRENGKTYSPRLPDLRKEYDKAKIRVSDKREQNQGGCAYCHGTGFAPAVVDKAGNAIAWGNGENPTAFAVSMVPCACDIGQAAQSKYLFETKQDPQKCPADWYRRLFRAVKDEHGTWWSGWQCAQEYLKRCEEAARKV